MNQDDKINLIQDLYLQETIKVCATSSLELLQETKFRSQVWDIYISGLAYGIWISICDIEDIDLIEIADCINEHVSTKLN